MFCFNFDREAMDILIRCLFLSSALKLRGPLLLHSDHTARFLMLQMMYLFFLLPLCVPTFLTVPETLTCTDVSSQWSKKVSICSSQSQGTKLLDSLRLSVLRALRGACVRKDHGNADRYGSLFCSHRGPGQGSRTSALRSNRSSSEY